MSQIKMKIMVAVPTIDDNVNYYFMRSYCSLVRLLDKNGIEHIHVKNNGSHINRIRNQLVSVFLSTDCTHLLFLDSDVSGFENVIQSMILGILSGKDVVAGCYPIKRYNWNEIMENKFNLSLKELQSKTLDFNINNYQSDSYDPELLKEADENDGLIRVKHIATGCMMFKREVFLYLADKCPERKYSKGVNEESPIEGYNDNLYNFFDSFVHTYNYKNDKTNDVTQLKQYLSEDYGFCHLWSSLGGKIYANIKESMGHHCGLGVNYEGNLYDRIKYVNKVRNQQGDLVSSKQ